MYSILNVNNIGFIYERYYNDNHITIYTCIKLTLYHVHCNPLCTLNLYLMCQIIKKKRQMYLQEAEFLGTQFWKTVLRH